MIEIGQRQVQSLAGLLNRSGFRRYLVVLAAVLAMGLGVVGIINYLIDPLQRFHSPWLSSPLFYTQQRFQNPGLARHRDYDTVVIGTSMTENFYPADVSRWLGGRTLKLSMQGATAYEQRLMVELALDEGRLGQVLWGLDWFSFYYQPTAVRDDYGTFPAYLFKDGPWYWLPYLLNVDNLNTSLSLLEYGVGGPAPAGFEADLERLNTWDDDYAFGCQEVLDLYRAPVVLDKQRQAFQRRGPVSMADLEESFERNLLEPIRRHPQVSFRLYLPPYSMAHYAFYRQHFPEALTIALAFRRLALEQLPKLDNVRLHDFQPLVDISHDFDNYKDMTHHSLAINHYILQSLAEGRHRVSTFAATRGRDALAVQIDRYNPEAAEVVCAEEGSVQEGS